MLVGNVYLCTSFLYFTTEVLCNGQQQAVKSYQFAVGAFQQPEKWLKYAQFPHI
jgi:hypothetical protein